MKYFNKQAAAGTEPAAFDNTKVITNAEETGTKKLKKPKKMKYFKQIKKIAGIEKTYYEVKGKNVYKHITSTQPFPGAKQPNLEVKFFKSREKVKDFATQEAIRKHVRSQRMLEHKKFASAKDVKNFARIQILKQRVSVLKNPKRAQQLMEMEDKVKGALLGDVNLLVTTIKMKRDILSGKIKPIK